MEKKIVSWCNAITSTQRSIITSKLDSYPPRRWALEIGYLYYLNGLKFWPGLHRTDSIEVTWAIDHFWSLLWELGGVCLVIRVT